MKYRKLTPDGDYTFGKNANDFHNGTLAVSQAIKTQLLLLKSEWWEDKDKGLPLFEEILVKSGNPESINAIDLIIQDAILQVPNVSSITSFESRVDNRVYALQCTVQTKYGDATVEVTF